MNLLSSSAAIKIVKTMANADKAAQQVQKSYFNDDVSTTEEYVSAQSPTSWRSTSISGVEDWCSVGSGTTLDDFKSLEDDLAEEYVSEDSAEDLPPSSPTVPPELKKDNGKREYAAIVGIQEPKGQKFSANIQPVVQSVTETPIFQTSEPTASAQREQTIPGPSFRANVKEELKAVSPKQAKSFEPAKYSSMITKTESKDIKTEMKTSYAIQTHIKAGGVDQTFTSQKTENIQLQETADPASKLEKIHKIVIIDEPTEKTPKKSALDDFPTNLTAGSETKAKLLSELEGLKSKYFSESVDRPRQAESATTESKAENVSYGFSAYPSSSKDGDGRTTDVSKVMYSKEVTESHSTTSISFQQHSFGANRSEKWQSVTPQLKTMPAVLEKQETAESRLIEEKFKKLEQDIKEVRIFIL